MNLTQFVAGTIFMLTVSACSTTVPLNNQPTKQPLPIVPLTQATPQTQDEAAQPSSMIGIAPGSIKAVATPAIQIKPIHANMLPIKAIAASTPISVKPIPVAKETEPVATSDSIAKAGPVEASQTWAIRHSDGSVYAALMRWAAEAKPQRQLIWDTQGNDFPSDPEGTFPGDFDAAIAGVMVSLKHSRYPVRACLWDNKPNPVVRIIHKDKRCND